MKSTIRICFVLFIVTVNISVAQIITFEHVYKGTGYDFGYSVVQTYDKGYAVAGSTSSTGNGSTDAYLLKTDSMGVFQWQKTFGGINIDQAYSIQETKDTGLIIAGFTNSFGQGGYDLFVIRTNRFGDTLWTRTYGGSNWDFAYSVAATADSGFVITGGTYSYGKGSEDMYLLKINSVGDTLWTKTFGGIKNDEARSVIQSKDGGYILTGFTKSFGDDNGDYYTVKTNSSGDTTWTCKYGGTEEDIAYEVIERVYGGYIVGGRSKSSGAGNFDGVATNVSSAGVVTWSGAYGGTDDDGIYSIKQSPGGRWAMAGYTYSFGLGMGASDYLLYIESPFSGLLSATFGGNNMDKAYWINKTRDNGYIICGNTSSYGNVDHVFLVKTDSNGVVVSSTIQETITGIIPINKPNNDFKIYPNPTNDKVYLTFKNTNLYSSTTITITDVLGSIYYRKEITISTSEAIEIESGNLASGIYIVTIEGNNFSENLKLIIER